MSGYVEYRCWTCAERVQAPYVYCLEHEPFVEATKKTLVRSKSTGNASSTECG